MAPPRVLFLADEVPWPATTGGRMRMAQIHAGLSDVADVESVFVVNDRQPSTAPDLDVVHVPTGGMSQRVGGLLRGRPTWVARRDWAAARRALERRPAYDLVWVEHPEPWVALRHAWRSERTVIDLDNVLSVLLRRQLRTEPASLRGGARRIATALDACAWDRAEQRMQRECDAVVVCSRQDAARFGSRGAVVRNGYDLPRAVDRAPLHEILFVATFNYRPNGDAARWLVREVLPAVRRELPHVRVRLVGRGSRWIEELRDEPGVDLVGEVDDVTPELARAGIAVAPLRVAGGTRIKLLEAFAAGVPAVATTTGAEGLEVTDGRELLLADGPGAFAAACVRLLTDDDLRATLVGNARRLHAARYTASVTREDARSVAASVLGAGA